MMMIQRAADLTTSGGCVQLRWPTSKKVLLQMAVLFSPRPENLSIGSLQPYC